MAGKKVLDFAAGSGLAGIACAKAGAALVEAAEIDPFAAAAIALNAAENECDVTVLLDDVVGSPCRWDVLLCGDVCYEAPMARHIMPWLRRCAAQAVVMMADPGRKYAPSEGGTPLARYEVPTSLELEDIGEPLGGAHASGIGGGMRSIDAGLYIHPAHCRTSAHGGLAALTLPDLRTKQLQHNSF